MNNSKVATISDVRTAIILLIKCSIIRWANKMCIRKRHRRMPFETYLGSVDDDSSAAQITYKGNFLGLCSMELLI